MENDVFSDYIAYADESGDHSLVHVDEQYPVFALSLCIFKKDNYARRIVPRFQELKFKYFGHDNIIFHEHEIRKQENEFRVLGNIALRENFMTDLGTAIAGSRFKISATVIDKRKLRGDLFPENPYALALRFCIEKMHRYLDISGDERKRKIICVFEKRGKKEDKDLELEFLRIVNGENCFKIPLNNFQLVFADKKSNTTGMQIADMTARPIGISVFRPGQSNRAFPIIKPKLIKDRFDRRGHAGLYVYPP